MGYVLVLCSPPFQTQAVGWTVSCRAMRVTSLSVTASEVPTENICTQANYDPGGGAAWVHVCMCVHTCVTVHMWVGDNLYVPVLSSHHAGPGIKPGFPGQAIDAFTCWAISTAPEWAFLIWDL